MKREMNNIKINRNRPDISRDEIVRKQNFSDVINAYNAAQTGGFLGWLKSNLIHNPWTIGSVIGTIITASVILYYITDQNIPASDIPATAHDPAPPIPDMDVGYYEFKLAKGNRGEEFRLDNGSTIMIPDNAFVDEKGRPYKKEVTILYREFHDAADILLSGITMEIDSAGVSGHLQTAGMFEILARGKKGEPLFLADGKTVNVEMVSYVNDKDYNVYYLDPERGWEYRGPGEVKPRIKGEGDSISADTTANLPIEKPVKPNKYVEGELVFDIKVDPDQFPELKSINRILWQYAGDEALDQENYDWVFNRKWRNVDLIPVDDGSGRYKMILERGEDKFETMVKPVLTGSAYEEALREYEDEMEQCEKYQEKRREELKRVFYQESAFRSLKIPEMGLWNCDVWARFPNMKVVKAQFSLPEETKFPLIYHITGDGRSLIKYKNSMIENFGYDPGQDNLLLTVTSDKKFAYIDNESFKTMASRLDEKTAEFDLSQTIVDAENAEELKKIIGLN